MTTIIGLCGSLRHGSFNQMLLRAAVDVFDSDGRIANPAARQHLRAFIDGFALFAGVQQRQADRRVPAALTPLERPQPSHLMASGLCEPVLTSLPAREAR